MSYITAGILYKGNLLDQIFPEGSIKAGQWAYSQGWSHDDYKTVLLLPNGEINHRAIIQVYDYQAGKYVLENHYTTCGTFHCKMEDFEVDTQRLKEQYAGKRYEVSAWIEY